MEFDLIEVIRARVDVARGDVALGIGDDAALLEVPNGQQLVVCTDTLVSGVHFPVGTAPEDIGWKALAVNLSDLAAMGAEPAWALLALTLPDADAAFVERFAEGFAELARARGVALAGGDTTQGPLAVTVTALGFVPHGLALTRGGARVGDALFVTGTLGDAAGALRVLRESGENGVELRARLDRPEPRIAAGLALRGIASACIDVSDGLLADLGHICASSKVGAEIEVDALPVSPALAASFDAKTCRDLALSGGDDCELCFTAPSAREKEIVETLARIGCGATRIGRVVAGSRVRALDASGSEIEIARAGWEHFSP
ncbi:MAG TPA: thiamine-phosphate kinase [Rhodanobacteraceae bacterium]|nr:thiamine-phosphate kinase [Rhodanobacteraceae bacterium]